MVSSVGVLRGISKRRQLYIKNSLSNKMKNILYKEKQVSVSKSHLQVKSSHKNLFATVVYMVIDWPTSMTYHVR